jgi:subfamily B ATP-binding cassette protein MsbA
LRAFSGFTQRIIVVTVGLKVTNAPAGAAGQPPDGPRPAFLPGQPPGALIERVRGDTTALQSLATTALMAFGPGFDHAPVASVVMLMTDWVWTRERACRHPASDRAADIALSFIRSTTLKSREAAARLSTRLDEIFHGIQTIKLNRLERSEDARFDRDLKSFLRPSIRAQAGQAANPA